MITSFADVFADLKEKGICKKMIAAWAVDEHTIEAASKAVDLGFVTATLVGDAKMIADVCGKHGIDIAKFEIVDNPDELKAVAQAVKMVHDGEGDVLMKGLVSFLISTDSWSMATSRASGPSAMQPLICPRSAILARAERLSPSFVMMNFTPKFILT